MFPTFLTFRCPQFLTLGTFNEHSMRPPPNRSDSSFWFWRYSKDAKEGNDCCSLRWISSHYTRPYSALGVGRVVL